jgi:pSer/pThr/pTyr-binding forkhead associated (FHA) protein
MMFNIIGVFLQYSIVALLYFFLFRVLRMSYRDLASAPLVLLGSSGVTSDVVQQEQAKLIVLDTGQVQISQSVYFLGETASLGRFEGNEVVIDDTFVSHEHSCITRNRQAYWLSDLHSTNGTFLNNQKLTEETMLKSGDLIKVGPVTFRFER